MECGEMMDSWRWSVASGKCHLKFILVSEGLEWIHQHLQPLKSVLEGFHTETETKLWLWITLCTNRLCPNSGDGSFSLMSRPNRSTEDSLFVSPARSVLTIASVARPTVRLIRSLPTERDPPSDALLLGNGSRVGSSRWNVTTWPLWRKRSWNAASEGFSPGDTATLNLSESCTRRTTIHTDLTNPNNSVSSRLLFQNLWFGNETKPDRLQAD